MVLIYCSALEANAFIFGAVDQWFPNKKVVTKWKKQIFATEYTDLLWSVQLQPF